MRVTSRAVPRDPRRDDGSAMIITIMVMVLVGAVATAIALVAIRNVQAAGLARSAGIAVDAADAGVSEGVSYLRANGVVAVQKCASPTTTDPLDTHFTAYDLGSQQCVQGLNDPNVRAVVGKPYTVLIAARVDYLANVAGTYQIVARGTGPDRARRIVSAGVEASGSGNAQGAFQGNLVASNGTMSVTGQSIFSSTCVYDRSKFTLSGTDAYGLPAAVHAEGVITDDNGTSTACSEKKAIHPPACPAAEPYDQDSRGEQAGACIPANSGGYYANGSKLNPGDLAKVYGIKYPPLSPEDIERLRAIATAQGNLRTVTNYDQAFTPSGSQAVVFYQMPATGTYNVDLSKIQGFSYDGSVCPDRSLVVVIENANGRWTANAANPLMASVFVVTAGKQWYQSGGGIAGSVYADQLVLGGASVALAGQAQTCANNNPSPATMTFTITSYQELDS